MDAYLARSGSSSLDQAVIIGQPLASNIISVGNIDSNSASAASDANSNDDLPATSLDCFNGRNPLVPASYVNRFAVSKAELLRVIGGNQIDDIRIDVEHTVAAVLPAKLIPSGVQVNVIEGNGAPGAAVSELLQGSLTVRNLIYGADASPTTSLNGLNIGTTTGQRPAYALISGGAAGNDSTPGAKGDYLLGNYARVIDATGHPQAPVQVNGSYIDVLYGQNSIVGQSTGLALNNKIFDAIGGAKKCFNLQSFWIGNQIDVCAWLTARFPGSGPGGGGSPGGPLPFENPEPLFTAQFDQRLITAPSAPPDLAGGEGAPAMNPTNALDVDNDGSISPLDALLVINRLNSPANILAGGEGEGSDLPKLYFDVNGDGAVTPLDALTVINYLNQPRAFSPAAGEGEPTLTPSAVDSAFAASAAAGDDDLIALLASDLATPQKRK
jgi:hypothetical protein